MNADDSMVVLPDAKAPRPAEPRVTMRGEQYELDREHPMAAAVAEHVKGAHDHLKERDRLVLQIVKDVTGVELPRLISFRDSEGAIWQVNIFAGIKKIGYEAKEDD